MCSTAVWSGFTGSIFLLLRMPYAFPMFLVSWIAVLVVTFENYALSKGLEVMGVGGAVFAGAIFLITFGLIFYSRAMRKKRVLK